MNVPRVGADPLYERDIVRCLRQLQAFLGQARIDASKRHMEQLNRDANPFRDFVLRQKQPWVTAFDDLDRLTLRGQRPLRLPMLTAQMRRAAVAGRLLDRLLPTFPTALADQMRAKLLDFTGRSNPVMMEWEVAHFYLRRGFALHWLDANEPGPEFRATRDTLVFEVECKRITRQSKELLSDRAAINMGTSILRGLNAIGMAGHVEVTTPLVEPPPAQEVEAALRAAFPQAEVLPNTRLEMAGIGHIVGALHPIAPVADPNLVEQTRRRVEESPHDFRALGATLPWGAPQPTDSAVVWLRGPRRTPEEHRDHLLHTVEEAAGQLSAEVPGLIVVEIEDVRDAEVFAGNPVFTHMAQRVFEASTHVGAILWRCEMEQIPMPNGPIEQRSVAAVRNGECRFDEARDIPLFDDHN